MQLEDVVRAYLDDALPADIHVTHVPIYEDGNINHGEHQRWFGPPVKPGELPPGAYREDVELSFCLGIWAAYGPVSRTLVIGRVMGDSTVTKNSPEYARAWRAAADRFSAARPIIDPPPVEWGIAVDCPTCWDTKVCAECLSQRPSIKG